MPQIVLLRQIILNINMVQIKKYSSEHAARTIAQTLANIENMPIEHRCTQSKSLKVPTQKAARNFPGTCFMPPHMAIY